MASSVDLVRVGEPLWAMTRWKYAWEPFSSGSSDTLPDGLLCHKGNALPGKDIVLFSADKGAVHALYSQSLVVNTVRDPFIHHTHCSVSFLLSG